VGTQIDAFPHQTVGDTVFTVNDLQDALVRQQVMPPQPGDAVLINTGWSRPRARATRGMCELIRGIGVAAADAGRHWIHVPPVAVR
jgi:hypothetical protein